MSATLKFFALPPGDRTGAAWDNAFGALEETRDKLIVNYEAAADLVDITPGDLIQNLDQARDDMRNQINKLVDRASRSEIPLDTTGPALDVALRQHLQSLTGKIEQIIITYQDKKIEKLEQDLESQRAIGVEVTQLRGDLEEAGKQRKRIEEEGDAKLQLAKEKAEKAELAASDAQAAAKRAEDTFATRLKLKYAECDTILNQDKTQVNEAAEELKKKQEELGQEQEMAFKRQLDSKDYELSAIKEKLATQTKAQEELAKKLEDSEENVSKLTQQVSTEQAKTEEAVDMKDKVVGSSLVLRWQVMPNAIVDAVKKVTDAKDVTIAELKRNVGRLTDQKTQADATRQQYESEYDNLQRTIMDATTKAENLEQQLDEATSAYQSNLKALREEYQSHLNAANQDFSTKAIQDFSEIANLRKRAYAADREINDLKQQHAKEIEKLKKSDTAAERLWLDQYTQSKAMKIELDKAVLQASQLETDLAFEKGNRDELQGQVHELTEAIRKSTAEAEAADLKCEEWKVKWVTMKGYVVRGGKANKKSHALILAMNEDRLRLVEKIKGLESLNDKLQSDMKES